MENEEIVFHPIGYIKSDYKTIEETPKHGFENEFEAEIVIKEEFVEAMADMKENQKYMVLFYFHKSDGYELTSPLHGVGPMMGLFSTHSPRRPNPIGVSTITVTGVEGNIIKFKGVDMLDGTPVLDIKSAK